MQDYAIVFLGAGLGGALRHGMNVYVARLLGTAFPWHTLSINILGSLAMGLLAGYFAFENAPSQSLQLFLATGILGGFTTFSAFSLDAVLLWERGQKLRAVFYVGATVMVSIVCLASAIVTMRSIGAQLQP
jgi:CrcB protein